VVQSLGAGHTRLYQRLAKDEGVRVTRLHDLRHLNASVLLETENLALVSKRLGHSTVTTTANTYHHILPGQGRRAAETAARAIVGDSLAVVGK